MDSIYTRRVWLQSSTARTATLIALTPRFRGYLPGRGAWLDPRSAQLPDTATLAAHAEHIDPAPWQALAHRAVDVARAAGATYADARLTRTVVHMYGMGGGDLAGAACHFRQAVELIGVGVRALVDGYWGFAAVPYLEPEAIVQLALDAVAQAQVNATQGRTYAVDIGLGRYPSVTGSWATPVRIDPFTISIEEKLDFFANWREKALQAQSRYESGGIGNTATFVRQERVLATSEGSLITQTCYASGGSISCWFLPGQQSTFNVPGLGMTGRGWELFVDAKLPEQFPVLREAAIRRFQLGNESVTIGRYTIVCDGATMASLLARTLGMATQLDRALGYEADEGGTSFIDDPLAMVGTFDIASPLVTVTANRSMSAGLATVRWDSEGVVPPEVTLIKNGVLVDFQTTREQAAWLAPYYEKQGRPIRSNGCAAAQDALSETMQLMPNLELTPSPSPLRLEDLVADVQDGILIEGGEASQIDFQGRNGLLGGAMRRIKNGKLGRPLVGGAVWFDSEDLWKHLQVLGGSMTQGEVGYSLWDEDASFAELKGQPPQFSDFTTRAVAATIPNQPVIDPRRKA